MKPNCHTICLIIQYNTKLKRGRPRKQKAALFYQNDCDLNSSENESDLEQAVVEQELPSNSVIEKAYVAEATVEAIILIFCEFIAAEKLNFKADLFLSRKFESKS
ncbi:hypothetical protein BpHYR1_007005 [Brachionus plicatilis]|uniref:Uncharacterized protein n=1 Tax=Brachionus plicatilis TaxID=10195 RepID=A0A3M7QWD0_BRAPC|nr:hypothetical protein BpHYR1_007005 [Brachionus plicatilis]